MTGANLWEVRRRIEALLHTRLTNGGLSDKEAAELDALFDEEVRLSTPTDVDESD